MSGATTAKVEVERLREEVVGALQCVYDPEIPINIYELGLIYELDVNNDGFVDVVMTLTSPSCPVAGQMPGMVKSAVEQVAGVQAAEVELTWDPPWSPDRVSEAGKLQLGLI
jgi:FeS assembly SUF system protein